MGGALAQHLGCGPAHGAAERAARGAYGRLMALLAARTRDVAAAEDALGDTFVAALAGWPGTGVPDQPEAWLLATARRRLVDGRRRARVRTAAAPALSEALAHAASLAAREAGAPSPFPDRRLDLLFACAHPAVPAGVRTPLMLQAVLGLDAAVIAQGSLVSPAAMAQRLVRAKRALREGGVPVAAPDASELAPRLTAVLEAIYAAFGTGWDASADDVAGGDAARADLADEALWLGRLVERHGGHASCG